MIQSFLYMSLDNWLRWRIWISMIAMARLEVEHVDSVGDDEAIEESD